MKPLSNSIEVWIIATIILSIVLPVIVFTVWKRKTGCRIKPVLTGAIIFVVFAMMLEGIPKAIFFSGFTKLSQYVLTHTWLYVLLGCLLAGVFEEVGRYVAFRFCLKKYREKRTAISYGIGHGGIESILVLGFLSVSYLMMYLQVQNGTMDAVLNSYSDVQRAATESTLRLVMGYNGVNCVLSIFERVLAMTLHISLSVVVFRSVWEKGKKWMLPLAIVLHSVFDIPAALYQKDIISMPISEVMLAVEVIIIAIMAWRMYQNMQKEHGKTDYENAI